jgi:hypothetical protein
MSQIKLKSICSHYLNWTKYKNDFWILLDPDFIKINSFISIESV